MKMTLKTVCLSAMLFALKTNASPFISEVMYNLPGNDDNRVWVEVVNDSTESLAITNCFLHEGNTTTNNHQIVFVQGQAILPPGAVAVIAVQAAGFFSDWPGFSGNLFHANIGLVNTGETIALRDQTKTNDIDVVTYSPTQGADGDGNSLQKVNGVFVPLPPTPGTNSPSLDLFRIINLTFGEQNNQPTGIILVNAPQVAWAISNLQLEASSNLLDWKVVPSPSITAGSNAPCSIVFPADQFVPARFFRIVWVP